ncbi:MAG TPA: TonB family protein [Burkholderiales bacterium]|jgi:protein TonB
MRTDRIGLAVTLALHALAAAALLSYEPARKALLAAAPIMVELIVPPKIEPPKPQPPAELPKPKPVARAIERPIEPLPVITAPAEAPSPVVAPPPPPPVVVAAPPAPPAPLTQPIFNADYLDNPAPAYPPLSRRMREEGRVILRVLVSVRGTADEVQVRTTSGSARLDEAARGTVRTWKFVPAKRGADPVAAWVLIPISFRLEG